MLNWLRRLTGAAHAHRWDTTIYNRYASPLEQRCRCGAARHILGLQDMKGEYPWSEQWRNGPRPTYGVALPASAQRQSSNQRDEK